MFKLFFLQMGVFICVLNFSQIFSVAVTTQTTQYPVLYKDLFSINIIHQYGLASNSFNGRKSKYITFHTMVAIFSYKLYEFNFPPFVKINIGKESYIKLLFGFSFTC